ncbi:MAG: flavodoxin [Proteobacteria bacterium]|nr:flavodoxin [Candidatus Enterousia scatequi]
MKRKIIPILISSTCLTSAVVMAVPAKTSDSQHQILVVYYSLTGNTAEVADAIVAHTGADVFEIKTATEYPTDSSLRRAVIQGEIDSGTLPIINNSPKDLSKYDVIFIGSPIWANHLSLPVQAFLTNNNLSGKHVYPFISHAGGGKGESFKDVAKYCTGCVVDMDGWTSWGGGKQRGIDRWIDKKLNAE